MTDKSHTNFGPIGGKRRMFVDPRCRFKPKRDKRGRYDADVEQSFGEMFLLFIINFRKEFMILFLAQMTPIES